MQHRLLAALGLSLFAAPALAQDADTFDLSASAMDGQGTLQRLHPHLDARGSYYFGAGFVYAKNPLIFLKEDGSEVAEVSDQFSTRLMGGYNFAGKARLDLDIPVYPSVNVRGQSQFAMGDIKLGVLVPLVDYQDVDTGLAFGLTPFIKAPTATPGTYVSNEGFGGGLVASLGGISGKLGWTVDAGLDLGPKATIGDTTTGSAIDAGAGISYAVAEPFRLGLELDQRISVASSVDRTASPTELHAYGTYGDCKGFFFTAGGGTGLVAGIGSPDFRLLAALSWRGATCEVPDTDGDGITDDVDQCIQDPEDMDGFQDEDGCPDDNDGDGVPDADDACPRKAGPVELGGCPDTDGDTLIDRRAECPTEPGPVDLKGCPDRDGDRFPDKGDRCPDEAGGPESKDGCPIVVVTQEAIVILDKVYFELNEAVLLSSSHGLLNEVAKVFLDNPHLKKVEIQGHTDDLGTDQYNLKLSQERAESVRQYLVSKGVDAGRLVAKGYGEAKPLQDGITDEARGNNRRVEFRILEQ